MSSSRRVIPCYQETRPRLVDKTFIIFRPEDPEILRRIAKHFLAEGRKCEFDVYDSYDTFYFICFDPARGNWAENVHNLLAEEGLNFKVYRNFTVRPQNETYEFRVVSARERGWE